MSTLWELYDKTKKTIYYWYFQWLIATTLYGLEPIEYFAVYAIIFITVGMTCYSAYVFLPSRIWMLFQYIGLVQGEDPVAT